MTTPIIEPISIAEQNRDITRAALKAARHHIIVLRECYAKFWGRDPQAIVDSLNSNPERSLKWFESNTLLGELLNSQADAAMAGLPSDDPSFFSERVTTEMPRGHAFDGTEFSYVAPVIEEPIEELAPDPIPEAE